MNKNTFIQYTQDYISKLLSSSSFNLEDENTFITIEEPYDLNGKKYQIFPFKKLTGFLPDPEKKDEPVLYTFFVLKADPEVKDRYLEEVEKMNSNQEYDKDVIGAYYADFLPEFEPFGQLTYALGKMLEKDLYPGKDYKFAYNLATVTQDFDIALVYLQLNSINALDTKYPGDATLVFKQ